MQTGSRRGPQYQPPQRAGAAATPPKRGGRAAAAAAPAGRSGRRSSRRERDGDRGLREREPRPGANTALLFGAGALVVAAILLFLVLGGDDKGKTDSGDGSGTTTASGSGAGDGTGSPEATPPAPTETLAEIRAEYQAQEPVSADEFLAFAHRAEAVGGADADAFRREVYTSLVDLADPNNLEARKFLGYTDFQTDILGHEVEVDPIPDSIAFRRHNFLDAVVQFNSERWLKEDVDIELARDAVKEMRDHEQKLLNDREYRAADRIRANINMDPHFRSYNYATRWASPYLICYSANERLSQFDLLKEPDRKKRREMLNELKERRAKFERVLDEKARIYTQLYQEFMKRYAEEFGLKDLMGPYGGREDYPPGIRSYADGCPLVIWIFTDKDAFNEYHSKVKGENIAPWVAGYFSPQTAWVYLFDDANDTTERVFEINKNVHEGTHQLEHWFTRQRNRWAEPKFSQDFFGEGIAEYLGSVKMSPNRDLEFISVNFPRLRNMQQSGEQLKEEGKEYPIFPADKLTGFSTYGEVQQYAESEMKIPGGLGLSFFYQQAWAFVYFLNEHQGGKYRDSFLKFFDLVLARETGGSLGQQSFMRAFEIRDEDEWEDLNDAWERFIKEDLMKRDLSQYAYEPPLRDEWPNSGVPGADGR